MKRVLRALRAEHGIEMIEAAVTLPIIFMMLMTIIQFGWAIYAQQTVQEAARQGVRYGVVAQQYPGAVARAAALNFARNAGLGGASAQVLAPGGVAGSDLRLVVTYPVPNLLTFMGLGPMHVTGEATGRMEGW
ncbi:MAG: pilus assembly protein [Chloroflexi bacterium]|nr:pilus assembly protein [Chloroflexota bacterium]MBU1748082.1 pilus assembly protein [Chloroflexota bacterium]